MADKFDKFRETMGAEKVDAILSIFGMGPSYVPKEPKKHVCPKCGKQNAFYREEHPDTDMNEMVLYCPDCKHSEET